MIVGLHGKMRAGKNTAAERIAYLLRGRVPVYEVSYAAKLKESAAALLGTEVSLLEFLKNRPDAEVSLSWRVEDSEGRQGTARLSHTVREYLQRYGTESHREVFGEDFWVDAALPTDGDYDDALYLVTDVRFPNESARIRELGGLIVKLIGPESDTGSHASEQELDAEIVIDNSVRDDGFARLDQQLTGLLRVLGLAALDASESVR